MDGLGVSELAERAGVPTSTIRFYERVGLLSPARRAANGYRMFDEAAVEELAFISRAKSIGTTLEDVAELLAVWPNGECRSLQNRLRDFLANRIDDVRQQRAEMGVFERQLRTVLGRLAARDPGPEHCGNGCGCEVDLDGDAEGEDLAARTRGCTLVGDAIAERGEEWRAVAAAATSVHRSSRTVRLTFPATANMVTNLASLCAAETACCRQTRFVVEVAADEVALTAEAPGTPEFLDTLFSFSSLDAR